MSRQLARTIVLLTALFFGVFFAWPVFQILKGGFVDADNHFTIGYLAALLADRTYLEGLSTSVLIAIVTTALALGIAVPLAWISERGSFPGKRILTALVLVPMVLPPFVGAIGIRQIFGKYGAFNAVLQGLHLIAPGDGVDWFAANRFWGVVVVEALSLYPIMYLNAVAALANIDPALDEAAENLGCTGWRRFRRVTLPLIRPGLFAGGTIVFIWAFTELGTPLVFDYDRVASVQVYEGLKDIGGNPFPYALVAVMLFTSVALYALGKGIFGRTAVAGSNRASHAAALNRWRGWRAWAATALFASVSFAAVVPHLGVILVACSRDWYATILPASWTIENFRLALGHDLTVSSIANSLRFAGVSTVLDLLLGVAIAYVIVRSDIAGRNVLDALSMLPLAVPGLVLAFGYIAMAQDGRLFGFLNPTRNPTALLIIAYSIRRFPYVVRSAVAGLQQTSVTLEEAATNLGSTPLKAAWKISFPLIAANLIAGGMLAFAFAMLEVSDSLILAQKQAYYPVTKAILELLQLLGDGRYMASALGVWAMVFLGLVVAGLSILLGKKLGAMFRV